jgi:hypothetical protein
MRGAFQRPASRIEIAELQPMRARAADATFSARGIALA